MLGVDTENVERNGGGEAQALALTDGEPVHAPVSPEDTAGGIPDRARPGLDAVPFEERGVIAVRHEADLVAVRLVGHLKPERTGMRAHRLLVQRTDGKARVSELVLREREQEVRLILRLVQAALEQEAPSRRVLLHACVVAGGN